MSTVVNEGKLRFTFKEGCRAVKYDESIYYRDKIEPLGASLAAVDIIFTRFSDNVACTGLIEIKDFVGYSVENRKRQRSGELVVEVTAKFMHTLAALFSASYNKVPELQHFAEHSLAPLGTRRPLIEFILFMEDDEVPATNRYAIQDQNNRRNNMEMKLKRMKSKINVNARILNASLLTARDGFYVERL